MQKRFLGLRFVRRPYLYSEVFDLKPTSGLSHAQSYLKNRARFEVEDFAVHIRLFAA